MGIAGLGYRLIIAALLILSLDQSEAVTVNPSLCPTNKIAPHKRHASRQYGTVRTFGAFYDLLVPGNGGSAPYGVLNDNNLQENPQEDDPSDCGEIEDYDENDLSSLTPQNNRRQGNRDSRDFDIRNFFGPHNHQHRPPHYPERPPNYPERPPNYPERPPNYPERPPNYPERPPNYPQRPPQYPQRPPPNYPQRPPSRPQRPPNYPQKPNPARPPYWSGGLFGSNDYRPPLQEYPSDSLKPIHEYSDSSGVTYRPNVVGGPLGHVVGVSPIIPTTEDSTSIPDFFPLRATTQSSNSDYPTTARRPRPRNVSSNTVLGSFVDLFFK